MPGVMDTILNVGLNRETLRGLIFLSGNPRFAWDTYRRFLIEFARVIFRQDLQPYHLALQTMLDAEGVADPVELNSRSSGILPSSTSAFSRPEPAGGFPLMSTSSWHALQRE